MPYCLNCSSLCSLWIVSDKVPLNYFYTPLLSTTTISPREVEVAKYSSHVVLFILINRNYENSTTVNTTSCCVVTSTRKTEDSVDSQGCQVDLRHIINILNIRLRTFDSRTNSSTSSFVG